MGGKEKEGREGVARRQRGQNGTETRSERKGKGERENLMVETSGSKMNESRGATLEA